MKRVIKFRAWDKDKKRLWMWYPGQHDTAFWGHKVRCYEFPVMQYTGLKDKNGKEIYDGDIVKIDSSFLRVQFVNGGFRVIGTNIKYANYLGDEIKRYGQKIEVIGNIYENPELLKTTIIK